MMRKWVLLSCVLFLGSAGNSEAAPLDSPDIVYVDGLPCNSLCQSYMAWSRQSSSIQAQRAAGQPLQVLPKALVHQKIAIRGQRAKSAAYARVVRQGAANSRQAAPNSDKMPHARLAGLAADSKPTQAKNVDLQPAASAATTSEPAEATTADSHHTADAAAA